MPKHEILFNPKTDKIIAVILYLAGRNITFTRKMMKLIYLADVDHLNSYRRPITYDMMVARGNGPIPRTTSYILKKDRRFKRINFDELPFECTQEDDGEYYVKNFKNLDKEYKYLSISDREVLDKIIDKYGNKSFQELCDLTHEHIGWKNAWNKKGKSKKFKIIRYEDLIKESKFKKDLVEDMRLTCDHVF